VEAKELSEENLHVERVELNGKPYNEKTISYRDIMEGASLVFYMTNEAKR
jgi:putative alpha-1,2-mannosidase